MRRLIAGCAVTVLVVAACGSGSDDAAPSISLPDAKEAVAGVGDALSDARTFRMKGTGTEQRLDPEDGDAYGNLMRQTIEAAVDVDADAYSLVVEFDGFTVGDVDVDSQEFIRAGDTLYQGIKPLIASLGPKDIPEHVRWLKIEDMPEAGTFGPDFGAFFGDGSIESLVETVIGARGGIRGEIETIGEIELGGVGTVQYHMVVDGESEWDPAVAADVWIDGDGKPRRVAVQTIFEPGVYMSYTFDAEFFDFGADVEIAAPPDDEVISWDDFEVLVCFDDVGPEIEEDAPRDLDGRPCLVPRDDGKFDDAGEVVDPDAWQDGQP